VYLRAHLVIMLLLAFVQHVHLIVRPALVQAHVPSAAQLF